MCEAKAYIVKNDHEQLVMQDVTLVQPEGETCLLVNLLGEQKLVQGQIVRIDLLHHTIHLSQADIIS